jgi:hypothetical protein
MECDPMKTLLQRLQQIPPSVSRAFRDYRYTFLSWLRAASTLFSVPAPVRVVNLRRPRFHSPKDHR